jgi:hypothetical protein
MVSASTRAVAPCSRPPALIGDAGIVDVPDEKALLAAAKTRQWGRESMVRPRPPLAL